MVEILVSHAEFEAFVLDNFKAGQLTGEPHFGCFSHLHIRLCEMSRVWGSQF
jgi:hypothetical protein